MARSLAAAGVWALLFSLLVPALARYTEQGLGEAGLQQDGDGADGEVSLLQVKLELKRDIPPSRLPDRYIVQPGGSPGRPAVGGPQQLAVAPSAPSPPQKTSAVAPSAPSPPQKTSATAPSLPAAVKCIAALAVQFMAVNAVNVAPRLWRLFKGTQRVPSEDTYDGPGAMIPLVATLLLVACLRAEQLSTLGQQGRSWVYGLPQWWAEAGFIAAIVSGIVAMSFRWASMLAHGPEHPRGLVSGFLSGCSTLGSGVEYLSVGLIIVAALFMEEPFDVWLNSGRIQVSASVACMMSAVIQYFIIHLVYFVASTVHELGPAGNNGTAVLTRAMLAGCKSQAYGPMLAVLLMAARLRALSVRGSEDHSQNWVAFFYCLAVYAALARMVLAVCVAALDEARAAKSRLEASGEAGERGFASKFFGFFCGLANFCVLLSVVVILISIFVLQDLSGWKATPDFSAVLSAVLVLTVQYFGVQMVSSLAESCKAARGQGEGGRAQQAVAAAVGSCTSCPVFSALALAAGLRAAQFGPRATPQVWVQTCIYGYMWLSLVNLFLAVLSSAIAEPPSSEPNEEPRRPKASLRLLVFTRALFVAFMYAFVLAVICGVCAMSATSVATVL